MAGPYAITASRPALGDLVHPAVRVGQPAELDAEQLLAQPHRDRPGLAVTDRPASGRALDLRDRGDDRGGAAREHLGNLAGLAPRPPLLHRDRALAGRDAQVRRQREHRVPGDPGQQRAGQRWRLDPRVLASAVDEEQVHPAHLLDPAVLDRIEPDDLVTAVVDGLLLAEEGRGVVAAGLRLTRPARRGPGVALG